MSRSKRLTPKPAAAASRLTTVGGNWQWSPASTTRSHAQTAESSSPAPCSGTPRRSRPGRSAGRRGSGCPGRWWSHRARRPNRGCCSTACDSSRRASASSELGIVAECSPLARRRHGARVAVRLAEQSQRLLDQLAGQPHVGVSLDQQSRAYARATRGSTRAGCPRRTARSPKRQQPLEDVVDGQVAQGAGQHLAAPADRLADDLDHGGASCRCPAGRGSGLRRRAESANCSRLALHRR